MDKGASVHAAVWILLLIKDSARLQKKNERDLKDFVHEILGSH